MKNCFILGFGRSGTSLMGGILHHSGYFLGNDLYPPRESNPKGFFENEFINTINEKILTEYDYKKISKSKENIDFKSSPFNPIYGQRWLSYIEPDCSIDCKDEAIIADIKKALSVPAFAYKDPRFNYTLPIWRKYFDREFVNICMFRQPEVVVESVMRDCNSRYQPGDFYINPELIFTLWFNNYQRALENMRNDNRETWLFVHYEQLLSKEALPQITAALDTDLDDDFISPELNRSRSETAVPVFVKDMYMKLCELSKR